MDKKEQLAQLFKKYEGVKNRIAHMTKKEIQLLFEAGAYENEAGYLVNNQDFIDLVERATGWH